MVRIILNLEKSTEENASMYFEKAKKAKAKCERAKEALAKTLKKQSDIKPVAKTAIVRKKAKKEWFEKFRWFISSEGFLVIGGRDATTNEIIIKKHTEKDDIVFHTDMAGSPFFVVKAGSNPGKIPGEATLQETADATACYSRAWKMGLAATDVFHVTPEQVSKKAKAGEALPHGAFMIYGKTTYVRPDMRCAVGFDPEGNRLIGGPVGAVLSHAEKYAILLQGDEKPSDIAKRIRKRLGSGDLDEIIRFLPPGNCRIEG